MNNNLSKRLDYIDIFRGIGIVIMILGHIGYGGWFDKFIHAFHMPMFFWISGFFYKGGGNVNEYIKKKAKALLVPYFTFAFLHFLVNLKNEFIINTLFHILIINTEGLPIAGALWFLTALFFTDIIYFLLDKWNVKWIVIPLVVVGSYSNRILGFPLPWALSASFVGLGLYWEGNFIKKNEDKFYRLLNMNWGQVLIFSGITTAFIFINGYVNMRTGNYAFIPLFWINATCSIFIGVSISKIFEKILGNKILGEWLIAIGRNSIVYVCLNQIVILCLTQILTSIPIYISKILIFAGSMISLYILSILFTSTKLKILIGKW